MSIYSALLLSAGSFALLSYFLLPVVEGSWANAKGFQKFTKINLLATLKTMRGFSQVAMIVFALEALFLVAVEVLYGGPKWSDVVALRRTILDAKSAVSAVTGSTLFGLVPTLIAVAVLVILAFRRSARSYREQLNAIMEEQWNRYVAESEAGRLQALPDVDPMPDVRNMIAKLRFSLHKLQSQPENSESHGEAERLSTLLESYEAKLTQLDFLRRVDLTCDPPDLPQGTRRGWWPSLQTFVVSKGFARDRKFAGKAIGKLTTVALLVSVTGATAGVFEATMHEQGERLAALEIKLSQKDAQASLDRALPANAGCGTKANPCPRAQPPAAADAEAMEQLIRLYWRAKAASPSRLVEVDKVTAGSIERFRERAVIVDLLQPAPSPGAPPKAAVMPEPGAADEVTGLFRQPRDGQSPRGPPDLERARSTPQAWQSVRSKLSDYVAKYSMPVTSASTVEALLESLYDATVDTVVPKDDMNWAEKKVRTMLSAEAKAQIGAHLDASFKRFLRDVIGTASLEDALARVRTEPAPPLTRAVQAELQVLRAALNDTVDAAARLGQATPPSLRSRASTLPDDNRIPELIVEANRAQPRFAFSTYEDLRTASSVAAEFDDYFPGKKGAEMVTPQSSIAELLGKTMAEGAADLSASPDIPTQNFERARSYRKLRGFARVGGVLLGDAPSAVRQSPDIRDIRWNRSGSALSFTLKGRTGTSMRGPFRSAIVRQALAFAADGRPVAVTMPFAEPLPLRKTLMHPAVEDTALGCRLVALDTLADRALKQYPALLQEMKFSEALSASAHQVYGMAWAMRLEHYLTRTLREVPDEIKPQLSQIYDNLKPVFDNVRVQAQAKPVIASTTWNAIFDVKQLPFAVKPEYYDQTFLDVLRRCPVRGERGWGHLDACIRDDVEALDLDDATFWRVQARPPRLRASESGVRDVDYVLEPGLEWLHPPAMGSKPSLRFMRTSVFLSAPSFETDSADMPWEPERLSAATNAHVMQLAKTHPSIAQIIVDADEFNILQRFFRLALDGQLGAAFPKDALGRLARELKSLEIPVVRVPRWPAVRSVDIAAAAQHSLSSFIKEVANAPDNSGAGRLAGIAKACSASLRKTMDVQRSARDCAFNTLIDKLEKACTSSGAGAKCEMPAARRLAAQFATLELASRVSGKQKPIPHDQHGVPLCPSVQ